MKTITQIKKIGKGERYYLYLDNDFFGVYEAEILAKHGLKCGQEYSEEFFENLRLENGDYACFNRGLSVLEKSMKTEKMLKDYLKEKGYPISCIEKAVEKIKSYGYIDDENFCENYILTYKNSKSKRKMKYDLLQKGVSEEIIVQKLEKEISEDEEREKCLNFAKKYMKNKEFDLKTKQKLYNHLVSKGFSFDLIGYAWENLNGRD